MRGRPFAVGTPGTSSVKKGRSDKTFSRDNAVVPVNALLHLCRVTTNGYD
jgi:hypothetical protein